MDASPPHQACRIEAGLTVLRSLQLLSLFLTPAKTRAATLYAGLGEGSSLCEEKRYLNLGYWANAPARLDEVRRQLDLYFEGQLREFDLALDWQLSNGFRRRALRAIDRIPYGKTRSYTEIARSAGNERAVRAAGTACGSNPIPIVVPCHRVLRSGGGLGGYGGGLPMKEALLELERADKR